MPAEPTFEPKHPFGTAIGKALIAGVWAAFGLFLLAVAAEGALQVLRRVDEAHRLEARARMPLFREGRAKCRRFAVHDLNPFYLFYFPFDLEVRRARSTERCHVDANGFRGEGPELAYGRKLAFLIGGSSVFGQGTSDSTTIAGVLNEVQNEYHVVNAGVPSFNSTQELFRLVNQLLAYEPDLVIALDGANDIQIPIKYHEKGRDYPPGTPESFDDLSRLVGSLEADYLDAPTRPWHARLFPLLSKRLGKLLAPDDEPDRATLPDDRIEAAADKYVFNHELMDLLVTGRGGRFVSAFQPVTCLHAHIDSARETCRDPVAYAKFHRLVFEHPVEYDRIDLSNLFDRHYEIVRVFDPKGDVDITEDATFFDAVHLWDHGDRLVALALRDHLSEREATSESRGEKATSAEAPAPSGV